MLAGIYSLHRKILPMSKTLERLASEVAQNTNVIASAKQLITGMAEQIRAAIGDEKALEALADELDASSNDLSGAVTANTPASPEAEVEAANAAGAEADRLAEEARAPAPTPAPNDDDGA